MPLAAIKVRPSQSKSTSRWKLARPTSLPEPVLDGEAVALVEEAAPVGVDGRPRAACCAPLAPVALPVGLNARAAEEAEGERELVVHERRKLVKGRERL
eukprot:CAMPEP_0177503890 /NCGR_PEP_ID=MMETSP0369-20130122/38555_1 /TAXON_ID=447022 ORGANISM="Scrippsiella hangoei-like, Strain SHHI-4" /NCGR_SAMPLE_ID=MMETSP0369 /ASSEMBLY_ACC=CAM_ASM_000364 /LENGTH=98 /DNA_ID=CAMNT_0018981605 /DNA_START=60 /DNA_END=353 /DNA_ORIENTATION=-